jgi:hypothetical protein
MIRKRKKKKTTNWMVNGILLIINKKIVNFMKERSFLGCFLQEFEIVCLMSMIMMKNKIKFPLKTKTIMRNNKITKMKNGYVKKWLCKVELYKIILIVVLIISVLKFQINK